MELNSIQQQKLERINKGFNFENLNTKNRDEKPYYITITLETFENLKGKREELIVDNNIFGYSYGYGKSGVESFLSSLEDYCKRPLVNLNYSNRIDKLGRYEIDVKIRDKTLNFTDIKITIGELAKEKVNNFEDKVKEILQLQKADKTFQKNLDRYVFLREQMMNLKRCVGEIEKPYYYSREEKDKTLKLALLSKEQYDVALKKIEDEVRNLAKKLNINVRDYDFKYFGEQMEKDEDEDDELDDEDMEDDDESYY